MSNEMITRVARALAKDLGQQDYTDEGFPLGDDLKLAYLDQGEVDFARLARAAITAMREPPEALRHFEARDGNLWDWDIHCGYCGGHKFAWQALIDEILK